MNRRIVVAAGSPVETEPARLPGTIRERQRALLARLRAARRLAARVTTTRRRLAVLLAFALLAEALLLSPATWLVYHVYLDHGGVPDLEELMKAYDAFGNAAEEKALKVIIRAV